MADAFKARSRITNLFFSRVLRAMVCNITARCFCPLVIYETQRIYFSRIWQFVNRKSLVFLEIMEICDLQASASTIWGVRRQRLTIPQNTLYQAKLTVPREFKTKNILIFRFYAYLPDFQNNVHVMLGSGWPIREPVPKHCAGYLVPIHGFIKGTD